MKEVIERDLLELNAGSLDSIERYLDERLRLEGGGFNEKLNKLSSELELDIFKGIILREIAYILKYGSSSEKIRIISEILKYLYPTKREVNMKLRGNINMIVNPKIMGEEVEVEDADRDNISEDAEQS